MKQFIQTILASACAISLVACGGSDGSATHESKPGSLTLNYEELPDEAGYGKVVQETLIDSGITIDRWEFNFNESQRAFVNASGGADYYEIDLFKGIERSEFGQPLQVKDIEYFWRGPDCSDTLVAAVNYPEYCTDILAHFGMEPGDDYDNVNRWEVINDIREYQNLPRVYKPIYGFKFTQSTLRVSPYEFSPLLRTNETAILNFRYAVSDGTNEITRYLKVTVNGEDSAPTWVVYENNQPTDTPYPMPSQAGSEKGNNQLFDFMMGYYDKDIELERDMMLAEGSLKDKYYRDNTYREEKIQIKSHATATIVNVNAELTDAELAALNEDIKKTDFIASIGDNHPYFDQLNSYIVRLNPKALADYLEFGESIDFDITTVFSDSHNDVARTMRYTVHGAGADNNPPLLLDTTLAKTVKTNNGTLTGISLFERVLEHEGDQLSVVDMVASEEHFGLTVNEAEGLIVVDPAFFTYLKPGETEKVTFTYKLSDGEFTTAERTQEITITGESHNLITNGDFETGALEPGFAYQWAPSGADSVDVNTDKTLQGSAYSLAAKEDSVYFAATPSAIAQNVINEKDMFYFSYYVNSPKVWPSTNCFFNKDGVWTPSDRLFSTNTQHAGAAAGSWNERAITLRVGDTENRIKAVTDQEIDFFASDREFGFTCIGNKDEYFDEFAIVKIDTNNRSIIKNGGFNSGDAPGWNAGAATMEVNVDASRATNPDIPNRYGIEIKNTTDWTNLVYNDFPEGAIKKGMRYIVEFDYQNPGYDADTNSSKEISVTLKSGDVKVNKVVFDGPTSPTLWQKRRIHLNTISQGFNYNGAMATDPNYDWASANDIELMFLIKPNSHIRIDNVRMYPVPQPY
ncbi:hypothetical protein C2869_01125 [Saccharobesus litoralis]|uniref:CBM-cenC domain-containing protein n=1 Tax=Saccharobesus litoralis TaxID=2172099 RepID=A0A2S0VLP5_9ALTE|nr:hypothetical protein [Saccharobesus litoralis]AWB65127.1 hypothetical protein C2869_01125 [Saccharobesus litoralis]